MSRRRGSSREGGRRIQDLAPGSWKDTKGFKAKAHWIRVHVRHFWRVWGRDVWLVLTTIIALWAAYTGWQAAKDAHSASDTSADLSQKANKDAAKARLQAHAQCLRSQKLAPPFVKLLVFARAQGVVTEDEVQLYRDIIPKEC